RLRVGVAFSFERGPQGQQVVLSHPSRLLLQGAIAAQQEQGTDQQDGGDRHFGQDQRRAEAAARAARSACLETGGGIGSRLVERRAQAGKEPGCRGGDRGKGGDV